MRRLRRLALERKKLRGSDALRSAGGGSLVDAASPTSDRRVPITFDRDDIDAAAAHLAYWWRMSFSDDYSEPQCEAPWWDMPARMALRAVADDRTRHPEGFRR